MRFVLNEMPSKTCNGKSCGTGIHIIGGRYLCKHNNLAARYPHLVEEWHPDNPGPPEEYLYGSGARVRWKCKNDPCGCHIWEAQINNRAGKGTGCPFCNGGKACPHNNLSIKFPDLAEEWHPDNPKGPEEYSYGSIARVKWRCSSDPCGCHVWKARICDRAGGGKGCPFCDGRKTCPHNNLAVKFPDLAEEWHPDNPKGPEEYSYGSEARVKWKCKNDPCGCHVWEARIYNRAGGGKGCPFCSRQRTCLHSV